jgi:hypothetical protein
MAKKNITIDQLAEMIHEAFNSNLGGSFQARTNKTKVFDRDVRTQGVG